MFYANNGETETAHKHFKIGLDYAIRKWGSSSFMVAENYMLLATNYHLQNDYENAIEYTKKALDIYLKIDGSYEKDIATIYSNLGFFYIELGDDIKALEMLQLSYYEIAEKMKDNKVLMNFYENVPTKNIQRLYKRTAENDMSYEEWVKDKFEGAS